MPTGEKYTKINDDHRLCLLPSTVLTPNRRKKKKYLGGVESATMAWRFKDVRSPCRKQSWAMKNVFPKTHENKNHINISKAASKSNLWSHPDIKLLTWASVMFRRLKFNFTFSLTEHFNSFMNERIKFTNLDEISKKIILTKSLR